jgi:hypothetical protein
MKNQFRNYLVLFFISLASFGYQTKEIHHMEQAIQNANQDTLMIFDLDNTVLEAGQTLGSDQWYEWYIHQLINLGYDKDRAAKMATDEWVRINKVSDTELVEQDTRYLLKSLQREGIQIVALTARNLGILQKTLADLIDFGIHFEDSWLFTTHLKSPFPNSTYDTGVIFAGGGNKGIVLKEFLKQNSLRYHAIRMVDDKQRNLDAVGIEMDKLNIAFTGYRYGAADEKVKNFNPKIAKIQLDHFNKTGYILSDKKAKEQIGR